MSNPEFHQCATCGYEWKHGQHGGHSCVETLNAHYEDLREKCAGLEEKLSALKEQARRVRNFSDPDDVFEAVPLRFILDEKETGK